ncbi:MAG TPA: hypothetical protein VGI39_07705 [Polyangiaceae bacterium]
MLHAQWMKLPFVFGLALAGAGCATSHAVIPPGTPVQALIADRLTLRGTAEPTLLNPSCSAAAPAKPAHIFELPEETRAMIMLAPPGAEPQLPATMLHVTNLDSNKTWCVMSKPDGSPATIAAEFPSGHYAVSVAEVNGAAPRKYEVRVEKL